MLLAHSTNASDLIFNAFTRDDQRIAGKLTGDKLQNLRFVRSDGAGLTLDQIQSLDLPIATRILPDRSWKRATLNNGDVLHVTLKTPEQPRQPPTDPKQPALANWITGFATRADFPLSGVASITHPPGTRCLMYDDFERGAREWKTTSGSEPVPQADQGRSGSSSLKCSPDTPSFHYDWPQPLSQGWVEFSFFIDPQATPVGECQATLRFHEPQPFDISIGLNGKERWYETQLPSEGSWERQTVPRRPGWHTVGVRWQPAEMQITLDGFELAHGRMQREHSPQFSGVGVSSSLTSGAIWIDDFAIVEAVAPSSGQIIQRDSDQLDLATGDQLFGKVTWIGPHSVDLSVNSQTTPVNWSQVKALHRAARPAAASSVTGWIAHIDLQPWQTAPELKNADTIRGAVLNADREGCVVDHPLCGRLTIPWSVVRRVRPDYLGQEWVLEGRARHLGNEVKSAFEVPVPEGPRIKWTVELPTVPEGTPYIALSAVDLEPAGPGTLPHRWLQQLQAGQLTSELWINDHRVAVLNTLTTGRGRAEQQQRIRLKVPDKTLVVGRNEVSIRLKPSAGDLAEFDDWELRDLRLEISFNP